MAERLVHRESPTEYFKELVESALVRQRVPSSEDATFYLVSLLAGYVSPPREAADALDEPLAFRLARALQRGGREQREGLRQIGDASLFLSGFFADSLARKLVDIDYYISLGAYAYGSLSRRDAEAYAAVFGELAEKFSSYVDVLAEVSDRTSLTSSSELLRLYEKWLRTRSRRSGDLLVERGIVPNASIPTRFVQ
jgi:hypothetical protein